MRRLLHFLQAGELLSVEAVGRVDADVQVVDTKGSDVVEEVRAL